MFHVPEANRLSPKDHPLLGSEKIDGNNGAFELVQVFGSEWRLFVICADQLGWEHVSVHASNALTGQKRIPTWEEMCFVKEQFWDDEDVVMQLHPRKSQYVNEHPFVLHMWRPNKGPKIPEPPAEFVGGVQFGTRSRRWGWR